MGRGLKCLVQVEAETTADTQSSSVSPWRNMSQLLTLCFFYVSAAVPMCLSVKALNDHIFRAANNGYSVEGVNGFTTSS